MLDGPNSSANHPTTATSGGTSAKPIPANHAGGGSGWGDPGFVKGETTETADTALGHVSVCDSIRTSCIDTDASSYPYTTPYHTC